MLLWRGLNPQEVILLWRGTPLQRPDRFEAWAVGAWEAQPPPDLLLLVTERWLAGWPGDVIAALFDVEEGDIAWRGEGVRDIGLEEPVLIPVPLVGVRELKPVEFLGLDEETREELIGFLRDLPAFPQTWPGV